MQGYTLVPACTVRDMADQRNLEGPVAQVNSAWNRIEKWLHAHAPASAALLRPAANDADIDAVEKTTGVAFPPALRAWYKRHDGIDDPEPGHSGRPAGFLPGDKGWYRLEQVKDAYILHTRHWEREPGRIPISCTPGDIWYGHYIDAREGEPSYGKLGRWACDEEPEPIPAFTAGWPLGAWLEEIACALELGRCLVRPDGRRDEFDWPVLTVGCGLTWTDPRDPRLFPEGGVLLEGPP